MDWQSAFNIAAGLAGGIFGWLIRMIYDAQERMRRDFSELERRLPETYARRDDIRDLTKHINDRFDRLEMLVSDRGQ